VLNMTLQSSATKALEEAGVTIGPRLWIIAGGAAVVVILLVVIPISEKVKGWIGSAAQPILDLHDVDTDAHTKIFGEVHQALALLAQTDINLQQQIDVNEKHRREQMELAQQMLRNAIDLLEKLRSS
jgi:hypothetical protein